MKNTLSAREREILQLVHKGHTNKEIACELFISVYTVENHRKNMRTKFGVQNTYELIRLNVNNL